MGGTGLGGRGGIGVTLYLRVVEPLGVKVGVVVVAVVAPASSSLIPIIEVLRRRGTCGRGFFLAMALMRARGELSGGGDPTMSEVEVVGLTGLKGSRSGHL